MKINNKYLLVLLLLLILGFFLRIEGFKKPHKFTFDEIVYTNLSNQLKQNPLNYTSKPIYDDCIKKGRELPSYLKQPLFKHPPLYCYFGSLGQRFLDNPFMATFIPSLIFGLALIPLTFYIGSYLFNQETGILASFLITLDPISGLCSQKIWLETTLTFFMFLAFLFIIKALIDKKESSFVWAAIASGLAILSKATGAITVLFMIIVLSIYKPYMFKKRPIWIYILLVFLISLPWIIWNSIIYKNEFLYSALTIQGELKSYFFLYILSFAILSFILAKIIKHKKQLSGKINKLAVSKTHQIITACVILTFLTPYMFKGLINSLNLLYIPSAGWRCGFFHAEPPLFYFRRLIELSPFYLMPLWGVVFFNKLELKQRLLYIWVFITIGLFIIHGNYQSRYILPAIPALLILAAAFIIKIKNYINDNFKKDNPKRTILIASFTIILLYFFFKIVLINIYFVTPNAIAYF